MARLGELLISARLIDQEQLDRALRAQVVWGARLGTNLVELGATDIESLGRTLGRQHGMPAALGRHFDRADMELQKRVTPELARQWSVVPLLYINKERKTAVAATGPLPEEAVVQLAAAFACTADDVLIAVAPELRIRYHLERVYGIQRTQRFLRSRKSTLASFPEFDNIPIEVDADADVAVPIIVDDSAHPTAAVGPHPSDHPLAAAVGPHPSDHPLAAAVGPHPSDHPLAGRAVTRPPLPAAKVDDIAALIEEAVDAVTAREPTEPVGRDRRTYVRTLAEQAEPPQTIARLALRRVAVPASTASLLDALRGIRRGPNRDRVAALVIETLDKHIASCDAALLLVVRGDVAISWKHFSRSMTKAPELAVPLDKPGLVPTVVEMNVTARCGVEELGAIDRRLLRLLGESDGDLVVVPIAIADRVVALIATVTEPDAAVESVEAVAQAAAAAFARLIRDAAR